VNNSMDVTQLLAAIQEGDEVAREQLLPQVYSELKRVAERHMRGERAGHTLQATALVNEAYLRLAGDDLVAKDRAHLLALAAQTMRRVLVDHARGKRREKRGGDQVQVTLDETIFAAADKEADIIELDDALQRLAQFDERCARAVEQMFFGGLSYEETAEVLGVSKTTVYEDLKLAKAWLAREMKR